MSIHAIQQGTVGGLPPSPGASEASPGLLVAQTPSSAHNAEIRRIEAEFGVDIDYLQNGDFLIRAAADGNSSGYNVTVPALPMSPRSAEDIADFQRFQVENTASQVGVVEAYNARAEAHNERRAQAIASGGGGHEGRNLRASAQMPVIEIRQASTAEDQVQANYDAVRQLAEVTGFAGSPLNRVAAASAAVRSNFTIPAEAFALDPFFGGAGPGADLVPGGGPGGRLSLIGIAHDTDWAIGYATGQGPLGGLNAFEGTGELPSGLHGLNFSQLAVPQAEFDAAMAQADRVPALRDAPVYDGPNNAAGWFITFRNGGL